MKKGFTLIELLIVIVVIGILAAMMLISAQEFVTSAKVTKIISDLNQIKKATTLWYLENHERLHKTTANNGYFVDPIRQPNGTYTNGTRLHDYFLAKPEEIARYFNNPVEGFNAKKGDWNNKSNDQYYAGTGGYGIYFGYSNTVCYVLYKASEHNDNTNSALKAKLKARAKSAGLLSYNYNKSGSIKHEDYNGVDANIFMRVFELPK